VVEALRAQGFDPARATMGLGTPGSLSPWTQRLRNSNTLCLNGLLLAQELSQALGQSVAIENDANCFALAEALQGAGRGQNIVFGVIIGTGCGGGLVLEGKLHTGQNRLAGEWGHTQIDPAGPACWCGQKGCLEVFVSGGGVQQAFFARTGLDWSAQKILDEAQTHDEAQSLRSLFFASLGRGLANLYAVLDPDIVVLGGGLSNLPGLRARLEKEVSERIFGRELQSGIALNALGDSAGVIGAAWLGRQQRQ
jgi:fructokinase